MISISHASSPNSSLSSAVEGPKCTTVYVANLPHKADAPRVREIFSSVGKVLHVKLLRDAVTGVSRGVGFVMFEDLETAQNACASKHRSTADGCVLQVRIAERSAMHASVEVHIRSSTVFLRNLPRAVTKTDVSKYCAAKYGPVEEVLVHPQSHIVSGPSPCNAMFVTFNSIDAACRCTEEVDGKQPFAQNDEEEKAPFSDEQQMPLLTAKMVCDVAAEMRKPIVARTSHSSSKSFDDTNSKCSAVLAPPPTAPDVNLSGSVNVLQYLHPHYQQAASSFGPVAPQQQQQQQVSPVIMPVGSFAGGFQQSFQQPIMLAGNGGGASMLVDPQQQPQFVMLASCQQQFTPQQPTMMGYSLMPQQMMWVPVQNASPPCTFQTPAVFVSGNGYVSWN